MKRIDRNQSYWGQIDVENLVARDHVARAIWQLSGTLERGKFLEDNRSVEGRAGAGRIDPRWLISVWVYGLTLDIGTARELERRLAQDPGLRWLCGDERVNHHTLSDFRVEHGAALDDLFSQVLAALSQAGMVKLEQLTVEGTKIEAQASSVSFRREPTLRERLKQAQAVVQELSREGQAGPSKREAAQQRAARERQARLEQALEELQQIRSGKAAMEREQARVSLSEPEARVMKNGQGGFAPAYNVQPVVESEHKIVVNVEVTQAASDQQQLAAALEREASRERNRRQALAKAGIAAEFGPPAFRILEQGSALECPPGKRLTLQHKAPGYDRYRASASDCGKCLHRAQCCPTSGQRRVKIKRSNVVVESFHQRKPENAALYKRRGEVAEFPHAWWKEKFRLRKFHVRGLKKVRMEMKWAALAYHIQQWVRLLWRPALAVAA